MTTTPQDSGWPVSERILRWAARSPERPAIVDGQLTLTYGAFAARVGSLVGRLRAFGVGRDTVVAVYLPSSAELVVAATAVLVAGGAYLAVDINQPFVRTRRMLHDSGAKYLVTMSKLWSINGDAGPVPVYVDDPAPAGHPPMAPPPPEPDALAYVTYTVGSSGDPTGVLIEHAGLTNLVDWYGACHQVEPADRMTQLNSPGTDAFALDVWPCLAHGATLHVVDRRLLALPDRLADWLGYTGVTLCSAPAPLAEALLDVPWPAATRLRALLVAGDQLTRYPHAGVPFRVYNTYGRDECTVVATSGEVLGTRSGAAAVPPIGRPIQGITAYVLDADLLPVGDDEPGQLYLTGSGLARGYLGPQARTLARFVPNPFSSVAGARMYATGDLVRRSADGVLHLLGSTDEWIRVNGHRVAPAEIEAALLRVDPVCAVAVVAHVPPAGEASFLVAYVVCAEGRVYDEATLRHRLADELPDHLVPAVLIHVDELPSTAFGSVDRQALAKRPLPVRPEEL